MSNEAQTSYGSSEFWSMSYRGHEIAVHRHSSGWLVYLNHVMLHSVRFAEARSAANWLRRTVDARLAQTN